MKNNAVLYGVIGLLSGALIMYLAGGNFSGKPGYGGMMGGYQNAPARENSNDDNSRGRGMSMGDMMDGLDGKTGDDFDKAFIEEMIEHHEGAIDMAKEAQKNAKHDEIKQLANDIITAQESEIVKMKSWQQSWGY